MNLRHVTMGSTNFLNLNVRWVLIIKKYLMRTNKDKAVIFLGIPLPQRA